MNRRDFSRAEVEERLVHAFSSKTGRFRLSELVQVTGLPALTLEPVLRDVVMTWDIAIEVAPSGEIVWNVGEGLRSRVDSEELRRLKFRRKLMAIFKSIFKVGIVIALIGFFVIFVMLMIAAIFVLASGGSRNNNSRGSSSSSSSRGGSVILLPRGGLWRTASRRQRGSTRGGSAWNTRYAGVEAEDPRGFIDKVFSFVFGPEEDEIDELFTEQQLLAWIAQSRGVISPMELSARTGWSPRAAETESSRLIAAYDGSVEILADGSTVYLFDDLTQAAGGAQPIPLFWENYEREQSTTGNSAGFNAAMVGMNGFILLASVYLMPVLIAPTLELNELLSPLLLWGGLVFLPALYALTFFAVPCLRKIGPVRRENQARKERNLRRVLLREIYQRARQSGGRVVRDEVIEAADRARPADAFFPYPPVPELERVFDQIAAEWSAEGDIVDGRRVYDFSIIPAQVQLAQDFRGRSGNFAQHRIHDQFAAFDQALQSGQALSDHEFSGAAMSHVDQNFTPASVATPASESWTSETVSAPSAPSTSRRNDEF